MIWDNFLFLEQLAPSPAAHARTLLRGISRMSRRGNGVRKSRNRLCFWPATQRLYSCWNFACVFAVSCSTLSEGSAEFRHVPLYIGDQVEFRCSFYKNLTLLKSKFHIWRRLTAFPEHRCLYIAAFRPNTWQ